MKKLILILCIFCLVGCAKQCEPTCKCGCQDGKPCECNK